MLACRDELTRHGVTVVCSRTTDANDPVAEEVKEANNSKADVAVSFHTNSDELGKGDGSETFYYKGSAKGEELAKLCEKHVKALGQNSRGVKANTTLMFIRKTNMTAVLCECAFIKTAKDIAIVDTKAEQKAFGKAYAKAVLEYLGIKYKELVSSTTATSKVYRVQVGSYSKKENAEAMQKKLKAAGFEAIIV